MKIVYLVEVEANEPYETKTLNSLKGESIHPTDKNDYMGSIAKIKDEFTHEVILPNGAELSTEYLETVNVYAKEDAIMLPLVILNSEKITGILNTCIWNSNLTGQIGELDHELAIKQIDLTLYGALIPKKFLVEENFNPETKCYQHFYFLNKVTYKDAEILGVPKTLAATTQDMSYAELTNEEKIKLFNLAKEVY